VASYSTFAETKPPAEPKQTGVARSDPANPRSGATTGSRDIDDQAIPPRTHPPTPQRIIDPPTKTLDKYQANALYNRNGNLESGKSKGWKMRVITKRIDRFGFEQISESNYDVDDWDSDGEKAYRNPYGENNYTDWIFTRRDGSTGTLLIYANDQTGVFKSVFVDDGMGTSSSTKASPGLFDYGSGPLGWILYQMGGWDEIDNFARWESEFSELARIYITYSAPLSSDVFSIGEGVTGESIEGYKTFTNAERAEKILKGIVGITELSGKSAAEFVKDLFDKLLDYIIEKIADADLRKKLQDIKKQTNDLFDDIDPKDVIDRFKKPKKLPSSKPIKL